jgi:NADPH:quinone reductase-like Zn-dependent oxidoreductase
MRSLVIFGAHGAVHPDAANLPEVSVDGVVVRCGVVNTTDDVFDLTADGRSGEVVVRVRAFSCNFRDRGVFGFAAGVPGTQALPLGSDFVAEVVAVGRDVRRLRVGDRVVPNHHYTGGAEPPVGTHEGIVTVHASTELMALGEHYLLPVPPSMPDAVAASFSVPAQTVYGMLRRLEMRRGATVLVTGGSSNTGLLALEALRQYDATVVVTCTGADRARRLEELGADRVVRVDAEPGADRFANLVQAAREVRGFDFVVDQYFDLYGEIGCTLLRGGGRYITCGFAGSRGRAFGGGPERADSTAAMALAVKKNLSLMGHSLGRTEDLVRAIEDYAAGLLRVQVDSVFDDDHALEFVERSFNAPARFGKAVLAYT